MEVWPFDPQKGVTETLEFLTDVISLRNKEERASMRRVPRRELMYRHLLEEGQYSLARSLIRKVRTGQLLVPLWSELNLLSSLTAGGTFAYATDGTKQSFVAGGYCFVSDGTNYETKLISAFNPFTGLVTFSSGLVYDYTDAAIMPAVIATLGQDVSFERSVSPWIGSTARFVAEGSRDLSAEEGLSFPDHKGDPVLLDRSVLLGTIREAVVTEEETLDSMTGAISRTPLKTISVGTSSLTWVQLDSQELWNLKVWLYSMQGRQKAFWLPSFNDDLVITKRILFSDTTIEIAYCHFQGWVSLPADVAIFATDGSIYFSRVIGCTAGDAGKEILHLEEAIGPTIELADIVQVCRLTRSRFDSDRLEFQYGESGGAQITLPVKEVPL